MLLHDRKLCQLLSYKVTINGNKLATARCNVAIARYIVKPCHILRYKTTNVSYKTAILKKTNLFVRRKVTIYEVIHCDWEKQTFICDIFSHNIKKESCSCEV